MPAQYESYISSSFFVGGAYALIGIFLLGVYPQIALLAAVLCFIAGMLPEIDSGKGPSAREFGGLLAAVTPIILLALYPHLQSGGVSRVALVVICSYLFTRIVIVRALVKYTSPMGMIHSIPAAIITFQVVYLLFWDLVPYDRVYVALSAFIGFSTHLLLDAYGNLDIVGKATGNASRRPRVLKLWSNKVAPTLATYACMTVLGWYMAREIYPQLHIFAGVKY